VQHTGVEAVRVSWGEGSNLGPRRGRGVLNGREEWTDEFHHLWIVEPVIMGGIAASSGHRVKVRWGCVVTKCGARIEDTKVALPACVHADQVWMIFDLAESAANIVITNVDLQPWIRDSEVVQPNHKLHFRPGEGEGGFSTFGGPIVDGEAPDLGAEGAIEDWSRVFEEGFPDR